MAKSRGRLLADLLSADGSIDSANVSNDVASTITSTVTSNSTAQTVLVTFLKTAFRSAKYTIQIANSTDSTYHVSELLLTHNGTTPQITEYGTIYTGAAVDAIFDADISGNDVRLLATPASSDSLAYNVILQTVSV
jgi:hypothetical protein|tara:strand:- start:654 stop:1061 length:408 start_codon:yes stop_codon:yes gene_type:complete